MKLKCPNCGEPVPAENINIQEMLALCSACQQVFEFDRSAVARKAKRRQLKPPPRVHIRDDPDSLELSYRFALGPGPKIGLVMATLGAVTCTALFAKACASNESSGLLLALGLAVLIYLYMMAVFVTTTTTIRVDDDSLEVRSGPLPFPIKDDKTLSTADIRRVFFEQTHESLPPFVLTHHVYAELQTGEQVPVVTSLPRSYAHYIAHTLDNYLQDITGDAMPSGDDRLGDTAQPDTLDEGAPGYRQHWSD